MHEASLYEDNCFITLTYNDKHLPANRSVDVREYQLFMKRLRKRFGPNIRFYHCGEYGAKLLRPHYHACLFNFDFADKRLFKIQNEQRIYTSNSLEEIWPLGFSTIGSVTFDSAAYVARYIMKKMNGLLAGSHYQIIHPETGEVLDLRPEYTTMSRRPGIGAGWFEKFKGDVYPSDEVIVRGRSVRPPKYYDSLFEITDEDEYNLVKRKRIVQGRIYKANNTPERLKVRETVLSAKLRLLPRSYEDQS